MPRLPFAFVRAELCSSSVLSAGANLARSGPSGPSGEPSPRHVVSRQERPDASKNEEDHMSRTTLALALMLGTAIATPAFAQSDNNAAQPATGQGASGGTPNFITKGQAGQWRA